MSKKLPSLQFYIGDWLKDANLSMCSPLARGIWIDLLCAMHELDRKGELRGTPDQLARVARCLPVEIVQALDELSNSGAAEVTHRNGVYTVVNRRMKREFEERESSKERVQKFRKGKTVTKCNENVTVTETPVKPNEKGMKRGSNGNVTPYSSFSSSFSSSNEDKNKGGLASPTPVPAESPPTDPPETDEEYLTRKQKEFKKINVRVVYKRYLGWCKERNFSPKRRYFDNWLATEDEPLTADFTGENDNAETRRITTKPKHGKLAKDEYALAELALSERNRREVERELDALRARDGDDR